MTKLKLRTSDRSATSNPAIVAVVDRGMTALAAVLSKRFEYTPPVDIADAFAADALARESDWWKLLLYAKKRKPQSGDKFLWFPEDVKIERTKPFFRVDQPRAPEGTSTGGQWIAEGENPGGFSSGAAPDNPRYELWNDRTDELEERMQTAMAQNGINVRSDTEVLGTWSTNEYRNINTYLRTGEGGEADLEALNEQAQEQAGSISDYYEEAASDIGALETWAEDQPGFKPEDDFRDDAIEAVGEFKDWREGKTKDMENQGHAKPTDHELEGYWEQAVQLKTSELFQEEVEGNFQGAYDTAVSERAAELQQSKTDDILQELLSEQSDPTDHIEQLDGLFEKASFPVDAITYRGFDTSFLDVHGKDLIGAVITDDGFIASTIDPKQAFGQGSHHPRENANQVEIRVPKGAKAIYIASWSASRSEEEVLINRGSKFKVIGQKIDGTYQIQLLIDGKDPYAVDVDPNQLLLPFSLRDYKLVRLYFDPDQPRAPEGTTEGGRWIAKGGFVSPSVKEGLTIESAEQELTSARHVALRKRFEEVDQLMGEAVDEGDAIGAWADGAEDSTYAWYGATEDIETVRATLAMKGLLADQKAVAIFEPRDDGTDVLYRVTIPGGSYKQLSDDLIEEGIAFHTIAKSGDSGYVVYTMQTADTGDLSDKAISFGEKHGGQVNSATGRAEFLGSWTSREEGRAEYEKVIAGYLDGKGDQALQAGWEGIRNSWLSEAKAKGLKQVWLYDPDQPRAPAGSPDGGRWTADGDGGGSGSSGSGWSTPVISEKHNRLVKVKKLKSGKFLALQVPDPDTQKKLEERVAKVFPGKTVEDVENMVGDMASGSDRELLVRVMPSFFSGQIDVLLQEQDDLGNVKTHIERHFRRDPTDDRLTVDHDTFMMDDTGTGFAKSFLRNSMATYQKVGVDEITLTTAQVGAYAWARFGFTPTDAGWRPSRYTSELEIMNDVPREIRQSLINEINSGGPKSIYKLADARFKDINIGKRVLLNNGWDGHLRLDDAEGMARFNAYVGP